MWKPWTLLSNGVPAFPMNKQFSGRVPLSCSVNNDQSYRLSVLLQYNLLIHCEQFRYSNLITILKINYLFCHWCSPTPPPQNTQAFQGLVCFWLWDGPLPGHHSAWKTKEKSNLSWVLYLCDVYCCRASQRGKNARKTSCRPNVYLAMQSPFHGYCLNLQIDGIQSLCLNIRYN